VDARHACMAHRNAAECPATAHVHYELSSKTHSAQFPQSWWKRDARRDRAQRLRHQLPQTTWIEDLSQNTAKVLLSGESSPAPDTGGLSGEEIR
jgi:hypothetical protein